MAKEEEKKGDDLQRMDDGIICIMDMDKHVRTTSALIIAKKQIVKEATDKLDVRQLWLKKLSEDEIEAPALSVNMAKELVFCGSQQVNNIIQMMVSYWLFEAIMQFRPAYVHGNWKILWNDIVSANKSMVSGLMVAIKEGHNFINQLSGMENGFANFVDRIRSGTDVRIALTYVEREVDNFATYAKEFRDKMSVSKVEAKEILDSVLDNAEEMAGFSTLAETIRTTQKLLDELLAQKHKAERDFYSATKGIGERFAKLAELVGRKQHADTMIAIANGEVTDSVAAALKFRNLAEAQLERAEKCTDMVKETWQVPEYRTEEEEDTKDIKVLGIRVGSRTTTRYVKKLIGYKTESKEIIDTTRSEATKKLAEQSKAFGDNYDEKAKQAAENKAKYERESAQLEIEIENLNIELETEREMHEESLKLKQKELDRLAKDMKKTQEDLDKIKHESGILGAQQMIDFSNTMSEFKIAVIGADACAHATTSKLDQFVRNVKTNFEVGPAPASGEALSSAAEPSSSSAEPIKKPKFLEEVTQGMLDYFGTDEEEDCMCEDEKEWDDMKEELVEELGLKKMTKGKWKNMRKWFLRFVVTKDPPTEIPKKDLDRLTKFAECSLGFLSLFSTSTEESSKVLTLQHPEFQRAMKYGNAGALPAPKGPIIEEA